MKNRSVILFHELNKNVITSVNEMLSNQDHEHHKLMINSDFTFDDALYSQYVGIPLLKVPKTTKLTIFVSTEFVCDSGVQIADITAPDAHQRARNGDYTSYCTVENLKHLHRCGVCIGNHGASHYDFGGRQHSIRNISKIVKMEVYKSDKFFKCHNIDVDSFAYPYNHVVPFYELLLRKKGITNFHGKERINIDTLL